MFSRLLKYANQGNIDTIKTSRITFPQSVLKPSISTHSKPRTMPRTMLLKCFVLQQCNQNKTFEKPRTGLRSGRKFEISRTAISKEEQKTVHYQTGYNYIPLYQMQDFSTCTLFKGKKRF